jgi:hypothetical protein
MPCWLLKGPWTSYLQCVHGSLKSIDYSEVDELVWLTCADRDRVSPVDQLIFDHLYQNGQLS